MSEANVGPEGNGHPVVLRYVGRGEFIHGVPARDLTADDLAGLTLAQLNLALDSGLYKRVEAAGPGRPEAGAESGPTGPEGSDEA